MCAPIQSDLVSQAADLQVRGRSDIAGLCFPSYSAQTGLGVSRYALALVAWSQAFRNAVPSACIQTSRGDLSGRNIALRMDGLIVLRDASYETL
jgi:hypothetical protein